MSVRYGSVKMIAIIIIIIIILVVVVVVVVVVTAAAAAAAAAVVVIIIKRLFIRAQLENSCRTGCFWFGRPLRETRLGKN